MTAVLGDVDLSLVTADSPPCEWTLPPQECRSEAVVRVKWRTECAHNKDTLLCAVHRDRLRAIAAVPWMFLSCSVCGAEAWIVRMEPVR